MKKQTAVEWLVEQLEQHHTKIDIKNTVVFQQAKAIEKQQISDAFDYEAKADMHDYSSGEQYYEQTYL
jgi:predicted alpha/beta-fold hydrolase